MSIAELNLLELKDTISASSLDEFKSLYGDYLIIGYEYGGEILFESTYSAESNEDKMDIEGELSLSFAGAGFDVPGLDISGSASVDYDKNQLSSRTDYTYDYSIRPNAESDDVTELLSALTQLSQGKMADDDTLYEQFSTSAQSLLSSNQDPIKAIVIPLASVSAVNDLFVDNADLEDTVSFFLFLNDLYMIVEGLIKERKLIERKWREISPSTTSIAVTAWGDWEWLLEVTLLLEMRDVNNINEILAYSNKYNEISRTIDRYADVMTVTSFVEVNIRSGGIVDQFAAAIKEPYLAMLVENGITSKAPTTPNPTPSPTPSPTPGPTPSPTPGPTPSPTPSPSTDHLTEVLLSPPKGSLNVCEADCDTDADCMKGLDCLQNDKYTGSDCWDPIPFMSYTEVLYAHGCKGSVYKDWDYCVDPSACARAVTLNEIEASESDVTDGRLASINGEIHSTSTTPVQSSTIDETTSEAEDNGVTRSEIAFIRQVPRGSGVRTVGDKWNLDVIIFVTAIVAAGSLMIGVIVGRACIGTAPSKNQKVEMAMVDIETDL